MTPFTRRTLLLATAAALAARTTHARGDRSQLVVGIPSDVLALDPMRDQSTIGLSLFNNVYDALTSIARDGSIEPRIAQSWDSSPDAKVWTFKIRPNIRFHDGTTLTAEDVLATYQAIQKDPTSPIRLYLNKIEKFEIVGDDAIRFTLKQPYAPFPRQVSMIFIVPKAAYERMGAAEFGRRPIGSGAFRLKEWNKDDRIVLTANPDYWGGAPRIPTIVFRPVPAEASRASALLSGELDVVPALPPALVARLSSAPGVDIVMNPTNRVMYLGFNTKDAVLGNLKLRQAIDMAINREAITKRLLAGAGQPMGQLASPVVFGYDAAIKPTGFDPARARQLVKESGYAGQPIQMPYPNNTYPMADQIMQSIAASLKDVGVNVELQGMQYSAFFPLWSGDKLRSAFFSGFGPSMMDADATLSSLFETGSHGYWSNPDVDRLSAEQRATPEAAKRQAAINQIWELAAADVPFAPLYQEILAYGISKGLDWKPRPDGLLIFRDAAWS